MNIDFGDLYTNRDRVGYFYSKKLAKEKINPIYKKVLWYVIFILFALYGMMLVINVFADYSIKSNQYYNLVKYHNINGFQPIH